MASNWKKKVRHGATTMPKRIVDMSQSCETEKEYKRLYPGVRSDHLPPVVVFHSKRERKEYFNQ